MNALKLLVSPVLILAFIFAACDSSDPSSPPPGNPAIEEDCLPFDPQDVQVVAIAGEFRVMGGNSVMMTFDEEEEAELAVDVIRHYEMDSQCFAERPQPGLRYFKVQDDIPSGGFPGEDCLEFDDTGSLEVIEVSNTDYRVVDNGRFAFAAKSREEAEKIIEIVQHYEAVYTCYVGRPNAGMIYLRK